MAADDSHVGYAPITGLNMYYEVHDPTASDLPLLVLLHGGGDTILTPFGEVLAPLAGSRRYFAPVA